MTKCTSNATVHEMLDRIFWATLDKSGDCWLWTRSVNQWGYGQVALVNKRVFAHRLAWMLANGPIPDDVVVCHNCPSGDNPACCNPAHLWLGTRKQNAADCVAKGRHHTKPKLTIDQVREIRTRYAGGDISALALAHEYDVGQTTILHIIHRRTWKNV